jgi:hypothetical protein
VKSFEGNTFHFRGGDPSEARDRLDYLLNIYGASASQLRVEEAQ